MCEVRPQVGRRHEELSVAVLPAVSREQVEQLGHIRAEIRVRREKAHVLVLMRGARVVVARAHMHVVLDVPALPAHHRCHLRVRLQADQAVNHVNVRLFERARPRDVRLLITARLQLYERNNLLAGLGGSDERAHDGARGS